MTKINKNRICPVEYAGGLDLSLRKLLQNPQKILGKYIKEGMEVLDVGCGSGYFSIEIAKMVGKSGKVIAADLQEGMLEKVNEKIKNTDLQYIIEIHKCQKDKINLAKKVDLILVFYMLHEVPNQEIFLQEIKALLKQNGKVIIVEPKFHVSKNDFMNLIEVIKQTGFEIIEEPKIFFSRSIIIKKI